ncbi:Glycopeptide antibiotics resistance protein [Saccharopolyspora kobensis]|uniref:Glycopeptide antibiotics resistance protein n=1 Tax=Saccharopolyspora kobensis TaxID=146035 RepID=A0A1H5TM10_9PSEU|nr:VanZ family protein [Saccharopolyspora kobensis]SEF63803.1 Glycopeptide antibiotics resistance protein [Saccharopolyspora kobensis]SFC44755.1 Glycopeptide antibiotics resistance protein [Saccharopolyspora kobensis]
MSSVHLLPIKTAALIFPLLAIVLFLPAAVVTYRRHGVMTSWRTLSFYSFLFYALTAFFMTLIPLPSRVVDVCAKYPKMAQPALTPGNTFGDIWKEAGGEVSFGALVLHNPAVWQATLNVALLVPLGMYLRYHFKRGFLTTAAIGLGVSLFFELTQYTGVWGLYACPYRLADVDDIITNTSGAMLGWWLAGPLTRWLPTLDSIDDGVLARRPVPLGRRLVAFIVDMCLLPFAMLFCTLVAALFVDVGFLSGLLLTVLVYFVLIPWTLGGTPGKRLLLLKLVGPDENARPAPWRLLVRAVVLALPMVPIAGVMMLGVTVLLSLPGELLFGAARTLLDEPLELIYALGGFEPLLIFGFLTALVCGALLLVFCVALYRNPDRFGFHELLSGVHNKALPHKRARRAPQEPAPEDEATAKIPAE